MPLSIILIIIFAVDAARTAARRGDRRAWVLGSLTAAGFALALVSYALYARGILPSTFSSQLFLSLILLMAYELSLDVLRASQLSRELLASQQRMRQAAAAANLSLWEWDILHDEIWVTEKGRERAGISPSERIDFARYLETLHPDDREPTRQAIRHALEGNGEFEAEYRVMPRHGGTRCVVARGQVERGTDGKPVRLRGVSVDVTERKKAEDDLAQHRNELAHLSRVTTMSELSNSLAHELNQPLGAILRNAEAAELFLHHPSPDLDEIRAILADIRKDDQRAGAVIDRMRSFLRKHELVSELLDVAGFVGEVEALAKSDATARQIALDVDVPEGLPPVRGDRVHLQQVLLNLIINAMDAATGAVTQDRRVSVSVRLKEAQSVEIAVCDNGAGIPGDQLARVFDPFFTTKPTGLGMGLPISRTIVETHGGRLWVENNPGPGATFRFTLPAADGTAAT